MFYLCPQFNITDSVNRMSCHDLDRSIFNDLVRCLRLISVLYLILFIRWTWTQLTINVCEWKMTKCDVQKFDNCNFFKVRYSLYFKHLLNSTLNICLTFRVHQLWSFVLFVIVTLTGVINRMSLFQIAIEVG